MNTRYLITYLYIKYSRNLFPDHVLAYQSAFFFINYFYRHVFTNVDFSHILATQLQNNVNKNNTLFRSVHHLTLSNQSYALEFTTFAEIVNEWR